MRKTILTAVMTVMLASAPAYLHARVSSSPPGLRVTRISLPGEGRGDYLSVDVPGNRLFVTHTTAVHILDLGTLKPIGEVTGLTYAHGVTTDRKGHAYVTDGNTNSVIVFDPATGRKLSQIKVGEKPDSILFDPASAKVLVFNGDSNTVSVIDPVSQAVLGTVKLPHPPENAQTDGQGHVYVNFEEGDAVGVINTANMTLARVIPLKGCDGPAPLAIDKADRLLFSGCGNKVMDVTNADTGKVVASVPIGGDPDGIVYDAAKHRIFVGNRDGGWTIVHQSRPDRYSVEQTLKIDEYAKTLALDPRTHRVFSSSADLVWPPAVPGKKHLPNAKPGTFRLIVVSQL